MLRDMKNFKPSASASSILLLSIALFSAGGLFAQEPASQLTEIAQRLLKEDKLPGLTVAVMRDGDLIFSEAFGVADRKRKTPANTETMFRTGSVSKALTSAALGLLVERKSLGLDAVVQDFAPSFPLKQWPLTVRSVAGHQSGIPQYEGREFVNKQHYPTLVDALDKFKDKPLAFEPGTDFLYSSYGWNLLGAVLEGAAQRGFLDLMQTAVFAPLGLERTGPEIEGSGSNWAVPYARVAGMTLEAPKIDNSDAWPSAGFMSSSTDLVSFGNALLADQFLKPETVELLWTAQETSDGTPTGYGLGWQIAEQGGRAAVGMGGSHVGATAALWILPRERMVIAALTNTNSRQLSDVIGEVVIAVLGEPTAP